MRGVTIVMPAMDAASSAKGYKSKEIRRIRRFLGSCPRPDRACGATSLANGQAAGRERGLSSLLISMLLLQTVTRAIRPSFA